MHTIVAVVEVGMAELTGIHEGVRETLDAVTTESIAALRGSVNGPGITTGSIRRV